MTTEDQSNLERGKAKRAQKRPLRSRNNNIQAAKGNRNKGGRQRPRQCARCGEFCYPDRCFFKSEGRRKRGKREKKTSSLHSQITTRENPKHRNKQRPRHEGLKGQDTGVSSQATPEHFANRQRRPRQISDSQQQNIAWRYSDPDDEVAGPNGMGRPDL